MREWKILARMALAIPILLVACGSKDHAYQAPSGNLLRLEVISADQVSPEEAEVTLCYQIPSDADWVLGRVLGDVALSDSQGSASMDHFELVALSDSPLRRCDRLFFARPGGFPPGAYTLTIKRLAASLSPDQDWPALQKALEQEGIMVEPLPDDGRSFALIRRPPEMSDQEASLVVSGLQEPVFLGPWVIPISLKE